MKHTAIIPEEMKSYSDDWKMSPGIISNDHVFFVPRQRQWNNLA